MFKKFTTKTEAETFVQERASKLVDKRKKDNTPTDSEQKGISIILKVKIPKDLSLQIPKCKNILNVSLQ